MSLPRPRLELQDGGGCVLLEDYAWPGPFPVIVPAGFFSDGATIPAIFWPAIAHPYALSVLRAALPHDYELAQGLAWDEAARRFRARLAGSGVGWLRRSLMLAAVTVQGWRRRLTRQLAPP